MSTKKEKKKRLSDQGLTHQVVSISLNQKLKTAAKEKGMTLISFSDMLLRHGLNNLDSICSIPSRNN